MEVKAISKYIRVSPRKLKMIKDIVIGKEINEAIQILESLPKRGSEYLIKTLKSAQSNAEGKKKGGIWMVKNLLVDSGPSFKRFRATTMGRGVMVRKRTSHITVILQDIEEGEK
ncbi:MAG TPA: 50S ribosomal protein L22 [Candidatus Ratteibacteria bacterium]|nr:50S ribosomal protein L22 [bacterium]HRR95996.1 50S ribosomal protein L22 [Candidatus Ratteibacteria bacterium]